MILTGWLMKHIHLLPNKLHKRRIEQNVDAFIAKQYTNAQERNHALRNIRIPWISRGLDSFGEALETRAITARGESFCVRVIP